MDYIHTAESDSWMPWSAEDENWSWNTAGAGGSEEIVTNTGDDQISQQGGIPAAAADDFSPSYGFYSNDHATYGSSSAQVTQYGGRDGGDGNYGYVQMRDILPLPSAPIPYEPVATSSMGISPQMIMGNRIEQPIAIDSPSPPNAYRVMSPVKPEAESPQPSPLENLLPPGVQIAGPSAKSIGKRAAKFEIVLPGPRPLSSKTARNTDGSIRPQTPDSSSIKAFEKVPLKRKPSLEPSRPNGSSSSSRPSSSSSSFRPPAPSASGSRSVASTSTTSALARTPVPEQFEPIRFPFIRELIKPSVIRNARPGALFKYLRPRVVDDQDVPAQFTPHANELREMLLRLNEAASSAYLREMADNRKYADVIASWVKAMQKEPAQWEPAIAPMLKLLAKTDMPMNYIAELRIARAAKKVADKVAELGLASSPDVQSAFQAYDAWVTQKLLPANRNVTGPPSDPAAKKRKVEESADVKPITPKVNAGRPPVTATKPVASTSTARPATTPKTVSADMSFFTPASSTSTLPKPRPKLSLPDIKKRDSSSHAAPPPVVPSAPSLGLLASTLSMLNKTPQSASVKAEPALPEVGPSQSGETKQGPNKKGHMVKFRDTVEGKGPLEEVRLFSQTAEELEVPEWQIENDLHGASAHQLDVDEGHLLRSSKSEDEAINWYEPPLYEGAREVPPITPETTVQAAREFGILAHPIGEPSEPSEQGVRHVYASHDVRIYDPLAAMPGSTATVPIIPTPTPAAAPLNTDLLSFLSGVVQTIPTQPVVQQPAQPYAYGYDYNAYPQQPQVQPQPPQNAYTFNNYPQATTSANPWPGAVNHYPTQSNANPVLTPYPGGSSTSQSMTYDEIVRSQGRETSQGRDNNWGGGNRGNKRSKGGQRDRSNVTCKHWLKNEEPSVNPYLLFNTLQ